MQCADSRVLAGDLGAAAHGWCDVSVLLIMLCRAAARVCKDAGGLITVAGWLMSMPVASQIAGVVYRWVARNRQKMPGGTAACAIDFEKKI